MKPLRPSTVLREFQAQQGNPDAPLPSGHRRCPECSEAKPSHLFGPRTRSTSPYLASLCRACRVEYRKAKSAEAGPYEPQVSE